jgi:colanic acid/amylovoran biosynthesis protein
MLLGTAYLAAPEAVTRAAVRLLPREVARDIEALSGADLVVSMGGGYLTARPGLDGYQTVFYALFPLLVAQKHGVPVVFAPQSFGPFPGAPQRWLVARAVRGAALALVREDVSLRILAECGAPAGRIQRGVDSGFAFAPQTTIDWRARLRVDRDTRLVGVTARRWLAPAAQEGYERAVASTIDTLQAGGTRVVLIPQVTTDYLGDDDRIVQRRIAGYCAAAPLVIEEGTDYRGLKGVYGACDMLIGTRFHSVIFSLTSGTPCIAIEYEHKTRGIMRDLGLESWVVPIAEVTAARLDGLVRRLTDEEDAYRAVLRDRLPGYVAEAERLPELLRQAVPAPASPAVSAARL